MPWSAQACANKLAYMVLPEPAWPIFKQCPFGLNEQRACPPGEYAGTVAVNSSAQRVPFAAVLMPNEGRWLVYNPIPTIQRAKKELLVATGQRWRSAIERFIKKANVIECQIASNRHIHSRTNC